ncbi:MAG TPA: hypothetical protein EYQ31_01940 [Candidatus Handelsmanbacteria bacterium]|nr:hypothetical protein [Candidatus Handelsmanbacteria bacterium]
MSKLLETAPADVAARVAAVVPTDEDVLVMVSTDIAEDGACYGERWLALTAQRLVVMEEGRIVEQGTHDEMMQRKGVFYGLVEMQQQASKIIAIAE